MWFKGLWRRSSAPRLRRWTRAVLLCKDVVFLFFSSCFLVITEICSSCAHPDSGRKSGTWSVWEQVIWIGVCGLSEGTGVCKQAGEGVDSNGLQVSKIYLGINDIYMKYPTRMVSCPSNINIDNHLHINYHKIRWYRLYTLGHFMSIFNATACWVSNSWFSFNTFTHWFMKGSSNVVQVSIKVQWRALNTWPDDITAVKRSIHTHLIIARSTYTIANPWNNLYMLGHLMNKHFNTMIHHVLNSWYSFNTLTDLYMIKEIGGGFVALT